MPFRSLAKVLILVCCFISPSRSIGIQPQVNVEGIVEHSIAVTRADVSASLNYSYEERDYEVKGGSRTIKTYRVMMLDGSPYRRLIRVNDKPLSPAQATQEQLKMQQEIARRAHESPGARSRRIAQSQHDLEHELTLMNEMTRAFEFRLVGEKQVDGRQVYDLRATPRPGYQPRSRESKVLQAMRAELFIDKATGQWVKARAEAFKPVSFGLFIARVGPGTSFLLEQTPVPGGVWQPSHFRVQVRASLLWMQKNSVDDETYQAYQTISH